MRSLQQPFQEPIRQTLFRTGHDAFVVSGAMPCRPEGGQTALATPLVLWPSFGGHWVEVWFLNGCALVFPPSPVPRLPLASGVLSETDFEHAKKSFSFVAVSPGSATNLGASR